MFWVRKLMSFCPVLFGKHCKWVETSGVPFTFGIGAATSTCALEVTFDFAGVEIAIRFEVVDDAQCEFPFLLGQDVIATLLLDVLRSCDCLYSATLDVYAKTVQNTVDSHVWLPIIGNKLNIMDVRERRATILKHTLMRSGDVSTVGRKGKAKKSVNDPSSALLTGSASPAATTSVLFNFSQDDKQCQSQLTKLHRQLLHCKKPEMVDFLGSSCTTRVREILNKVYDGCKWC